MLKINLAPTGVWQKNYLASKGLTLFLTLGIFTTEGVKKDNNNKNNYINNNF